ncbi:MAG: hypothetical protein ABEJ71_00560 [Halodesulfurarchaeum sp.]
MGAPQLDNSVPIERMSGGETYQIVLEEGTTFCLVVERVHRFPNPDPETWVYATSEDFGWDGLGYLTAVYDTYPPETPEDRRIELYRAVHVDPDSGDRRRGTTIDPSAWRTEGRQVGTIDRIEERCK